MCTHVILQPPHLNRKINFFRNVYGISSLKAGIGMHLNFAYEILFIGYFCMASVR